MERGSIPAADVPGGIDLQSTLESAQTFLWTRDDDEPYGAPSAHGGGEWYHTVAGDDVVCARRRGDALEWRATTDAAPLLRRRLRLDDDLDAIFATLSAVADADADGPLARARRSFPGLRVVRDPFFPCLISFICSSRMPVARIHAARRDLAAAFGDEVTVEGDAFRAFPRPAQLAAATESELRDLGLGFRAPYVAETASMVADGDLTAEDLRDDPYPTAHERLQAFRGVGPKVADCVALFALGHLEAVPVDTWTRRLIEEHYPECARDSDGATADAFRKKFGAYAGYAQTYLYHAARS